MTDASPVQPDAIHVYWRPGCGFCSMLRRGMDKAGIETIDHNIWDDANDAAIVRRYANGNETVPTVVVGDVGLVNPSVKQLTAHLADRAPHLLPVGFEPPKPGIVGRLLGG
ncbi:MAG: glutaredoxin domain-containing protein [Ilumatobacteraceae bacterium]